MKNGDDDSSPDPIDEFLPWQDQKFNANIDLSPVSSSRYSSCGESEFDKYCSANSVMGTPSMCSSVGPFREGGFESEFGSFRSLENFSLGGSFERKFDDKRVLYEESVESCDSKKRIDKVKVGERLERIDGALNSCDSSSGCIDFRVQRGAEVIPDLSSALDEGLYGEDGGGGVLSWDCATSGVMQSFDNDHMLQKESAEANVETVSDIGVDTLNGDSHSSKRIDLVDSCLVNMESDVGCDFTNGGRCSDEGEGSSRYEYSEGEDSLFGYGTGDDDKQSNSYDNRSIHYPQDKIRKNEKTLLMNSSVAFGSDDWDDYVQETTANPGLSMAPDDLWVPRQKSLVSDTDNMHSTFVSSNGLQSICLPVKEEGARDIIDSVHNANGLSLDIGTFTTDGLLKTVDTGKKYVRSETYESLGVSQPAEFPQKCSENKVFMKEHDVLVEDRSLKAELNIREDTSKGENCCTGSMDKASISHSSRSIHSEKTTEQLDSLSKVTVSHPHSTPMEASEFIMEESLEDHASNSLQLMEENIVNKTIKEFPASKHPAPIEVGSQSVNEFYDEVVHEMEDILLDSNESPGARFIQSNRSSQSQMSMPLRDGGSTASTSSSENAYLLMNRTLRIDRVDVVGARQKKGDVSLSERLVGVKEYTVYKLIVWSGEDKWEVERRYRDFCTLYRRLNTLFAGQGWILPTPWSSVERESRKIFGNSSAAVIADRSILIKDCLQSLIDSQFSSNLLSPLIWFLSPPKDDPCFPSSGSEMLQARHSNGDHARNVSSFGQTISLVVKIWPSRSKKQILEAQHYTCSGCHKHFDDGKTRMQDLVLTLGWGKPRLCEYSGQFFCVSCHTNETAVLPARVLHFWDFTQYPVSQMAKYYLDSIHDQPMLCVSAVNPLLFSKVPALQLVTNVRKKIGAMLPFVRCPFRRTIFIGLGSRRYLLESNDFFALKDLIDLSKGVFAALPVTVETVSKRILEHITEQCLVCCDVGVPCNARQACEDPSSLIFPFQEGEVERCTSCKVLFHIRCFKKITTCPCGVHIELDETKKLKTQGITNVRDDAGTLNVIGKQDDTQSSVNFLSGLFSKAKLEKLWVHKDHDNVISMGSLPSTSL